MTRTRLILLSLAITAPFFGCPTPLPQVTGEQLRCFCTGTSPKIEVETEIKCPSGTSCPGAKVKRDIGSQFNAWQLTVCAPTWTVSAEQACVQECPLSRASFSDVKVVNARFEGQNTCQRALGQGTSALMSSAQTTASALLVSGSSLVSVTAPPGSPLPTIAQLRPQGEVWLSAPRCAGTSCPFALNWLSVRVPTFNISGASVQDFRIQADGPLLGTRDPSSGAISLSSPRLLATGRINGGTTGKVETISAPATGVMSFGSGSTNQLTLNLTATSSTSPQVTLDMSLVFRFADGEPTPEVFAAIDPEDNSILLDGTGSTTLLGNDASASRFFWIGRYDQLQAGSAVLIAEGPIVKVPRFPTGGVKPVCLHMRSPTGYVASRCLADAEVDDLVARSTSVPRETMRGLDKNVMTCSSTLARTAGVATFTRLIQKAGLTGLLNQGDALTFIVPSDRYFNQDVAGLIALEAPENVAALQDYVLNHVLLAGDLTWNAIVELDPSTRTASGDPLNLASAGDGPTTVRCDEKLARFHIIDGDVTSLRDKLGANVGFQWAAPEAQPGFFSICPF
jgi:uncharacterized surface protein with fasciclin (FAS1) repeats